MKNHDVNIRDPFVLTHQGRYYMYGTRGKTCWGHADGFDVFTGTDLMNWDGPFEVFHAPEGFWADRHFWAPEVHLYNGRFYLFASFKSETLCRGTQILISDSPLGPFMIHSDGPVTPRDWECLDGTLYVDGKGCPYIVFCHEWLQVKDGRICALQLSGDLSKSVGVPMLLFRGSDPTWADRDEANYVTDGPFLFSASDGELSMIWSSFVHHRSNASAQANEEGNYVQAVSRSTNGCIDGTWIHDSKLLFEKDGGHGMIFKDLAGMLKLALHKPNTTLQERPCFFDLVEKDGILGVDE